MTEIESLRHDVEVLKDACCRLAEAANWSPGPFTPILDWSKVLCTTLERFGLVKLEEDGKSYRFRPWK
jgi:hypothetical protein